MRAVVLGLVGAVVLGGAAQAGECKLDSPMVASSRAQWPSDLKRPDLVGKTFTVEKLASEWQPATRRGYVAYLLAADGERFVSVQSVDMPADFSESFPASDPRAAKIAWGHRNRAFEAKGYISGGILADEGPLQLLNLKPKC